MKKKSASQSAFFNVRVLFGLCIALAGVFLALVGLDAFAAPGISTKVKNHIITSSNTPLVPVGFDCSKIAELGIDKQENMRAGAIMIACGVAEGGSPIAGGTTGSSTFSRLINNLLPAPLFIGGSDVDVIRLALLTLT